MLEACMMTRVLAGTKPSSFTDGPTVILMGYDIVRYLQLSRRADCWQFVFMLDHDSDDSASVGYIDLTWVTIAA